MPVGGRVALGAAKVRLRGRSLRLEIVTSVRIPRVGTGRVVRYLATKSALRNERHLLEVHEYSSGLREILLDLSPGEDIPLYQPRLVPGPSIKPMLNSVRLWGVAYEPVGADAAPVDPATLLLSEGRSPEVIEVKRDKGSEWRRLSPRTMRLDDDRPSGLPTYADGRR